MLLFVRFSLRYSAVKPVSTSFIEIVQWEIFRVFLNPSTQGPLPVLPPSLPIAHQRNPPPKPKPSYVASPRRQSRNHHQQQ